MSTYRLYASYLGGLNMGLDQKLEEAAGKGRDGSGCGLGGRDIDWSFDSAEEAEAARKRLQQLDLPDLETAVYPDEETDDITETDT